MKITLIGYGKMGKIIEQVAQQRGHEIVFRGTEHNQEWKTQNDKPDWDVAIEFTSPEAVLDNLHNLVRLGIPTVCGTTGWNEEYPNVCARVKEHKGSFLSASNFSVGVNIFFTINKQLARLMNHQNYQVDMTEIHHTEKKDAPSGTAITAAECILSEMDGLDAWHLNSDGPKEKSLPIEALRLPEVPGTHTVNYRSVIDTLTFTHQAHSREGFALGAVLGAEFIFNKIGVFTMQDVLNIQFD